MGQEYTQWIPSLHVYPGFLQGGPEPNSPKWAMNFSSKKIYLRPASVHLAAKVFAASPQVFPPKEAR